MKYYPLFMDLAGRGCLVVGAGAVAARKARSLLECGARVTVVGERPAALFRSLERRGVRLLQRRFRAGDVEGQSLVITATDQRAVNAAVAAAARHRGIPVNAVDDPPNCTFIVPAVVRRGDLTVAISTGGKSPAAARLVKERIAALIGDEYAALVRLLGRYRGRMQGQVPGQECRARAWKRMLDEGLLESLRRGDRIGATQTVRRCLTDAALPGRRSDTRRGTPMSGPAGGITAPAGASPGAPPSRPRRRLADDPTAGTARLAPLKSLKKAGRGRRTKPRAVRHQAGRR